MQPKLSARMALSAAVEPMLTRLRRVQPTKEIAIAFVGTALFGWICPTRVNACRPPEHVEHSLPGRQRSNMARHGHEIEPELDGWP